MKIGIHFQLTNAAEIVAAVPKNIIISVEIVIIVSVIARSVSF
jgi:hypothetical protein